MRNRSQITCIVKTSKKRKKEEQEIALYLNGVKYKSRTHEPVKMKIQHFNSKHRNELIRLPDSNSYKKKKKAFSLCN